MDKPTAEIVLGSIDNPVLPFFSPDGQWIGYWSLADRELKKISVGGGTPVTLCNVDYFTGASWNADNTIVYGASISEILRVSGEGGTPETLFKSGNIEVVAFPQILPEKNWVLFTSITGKEEQIVVQSLESEVRKKLIQGKAGRYLPTGHIVYGSGNNLFAAAFDLDSLELSGSPALIIEGIAGGSTSESPQFAVSDSGTLAYISGIGSSSRLNQRILVWVDRQGNEIPIPVPPGVYFGPRTSPDGTQIALTVDSGQNTDIYIWDTVRENLRQLTFNEADEAGLLYSNNSYFRTWPDVH